MRVISPESGYPARPSHNRANRDQKSSMDRMEHTAKGL